MSRRKSTATAPLIPPASASAVRRSSTRTPKSVQAARVDVPEVSRELEETPSSIRSATTKRVMKRKNLDRDAGPPPSKRSQRLPPPPPPPPEPESESEPSEASSPEATPSPPRRQPKSLQGRREDAESDADADAGNIEIRVHKLPPSAGGTRQINEIDGLLQVTTEILSNTTQRIQRQDATQAKILDAFTEEVAIRLIEMTDAWDNHAVLQAAVRRAQKRKNLLRRELLAIRSERAEIRREMEAVRQSHELGERELEDFKKQSDFIADMEDLNARVNGADEGEDHVKVHIHFMHRK